MSDSWVREGKGKTVILGQGDHVSEFQMFMNLSSFSFFSFSRVDLDTHLASQSPQLPNIRCLNQDAVRDTTVNLWKFTSWWEDVYWLCSQL